jgi:D-sedoheptulose 7-phosphate isomerase
LGSEKTEGGSNSNQKHATTLPFTMDYFAHYQDSIHQALSGTIATVGMELVTKSEGLDALCVESRTIRGSDRCQFFAGNGASAAFGGHMALDWSKNGGVRSLALTDPPLLSATANDLGAEEMFAGPISWLGREGDLLVSISSSGNSPNVIRAIEAARERRMRVVTFSGLKSENRSRALGDVNFYVPAKTYGIVECVHQIVLHAWLDRYMDVREWDREEEQNMRLTEFVP